MHILRQHRGPGVTLALCNRRSAQVFSAIGALLVTALLVSSGEALAQDRRGQPIRTAPQSEAPNPLIDAASPSESRWPPATRVRKKTTTMPFPAQRAKSCWTAAIAAGGS